MITDDELNRIDALCKSATPGPWALKADDDFDFEITTGLQDYEPQLRYAEEYDAKFIVESRELMPKLVAEFREIKKDFFELVELVTTYLQVEDYDGFGDLFESKSDISAGD